MWHARLVRDDGGFGAVCCNEADSMQESLMVNVAVSVAERCLLGSDSLSTQVAVKGSKIEAGAQEPGAVKALPMQAMCKQRNQQDGTECVRIILILIPAFACCSGRSAMAAIDRRIGRQFGRVSHRRHGTDDSFGTDDSAYLHVWVRQASCSVMVMMTKRLETSLGPGKA